ncbi:Hypothetical predicted protein [Prunus dulcis]|uniref:Uncharacterized protein n=1 Tax=Prunus dulcis TaxID=3755 RepID=A0A5E4FRV0_PRUDU|nr:Hypothetical predicted protein [Prunus dulcis]
MENMYDCETGMAADIGQNGLHDHYETNGLELSRYWECSDSFHTKGARKALNS